MKLTALILALMASPILKAEVIQFPDEELAKESVLPKFDRLETVKNRNISTAGRLEVGGYAGWNFTQAIYNPMKMGLNVGFHWSEFSGILINYAKWSAGLNTMYTDSIKSQYSVDFSRVPKINSSIFMNYEYRIYYGKLSITKQKIMNISLYPLLGVGMTQYDHKSYFGFNAGIGWKFYLTKNLALRPDFYVQYSPAPDPTSAGGTKLVQGTATSSDFSDKSYWGTHLDVGLTYIF